MESSQLVVMKQGQDQSIKFTWHMPTAADRPHTFQGLVSFFNLISRLISLVYFGKLALVHSSLECSTVECKMLNSKIDVFA